MLSLTHSSYETAHTAIWHGVEHLFLDLTKIFQYSDCSLLKHSDEAIPEKSYAEQIEETKGDTPVSTYVPFRNGLFLSSAWFQED